MQQPLAEFTRRMHELRDLSGAVGILGWDQETYMPPRAGEARAFQLSALQGLYHERLTAPAFGEAIAALEAQPGLAEEQRAMVRVARWEHDRAVKQPARLVMQLAEEQSRAVEAWRAAREKRDFALFRPHLETLVALKREQADALGGGGERYDALLEGYEPGMRVERLVPLLEKLRAGLVPLVQAIVDSGRRPADPFAGQGFDAAGQLEVSLRVLRDMGFDFESGRLDRSLHPFTGGANHPCDVRLTTRLLPENPLSGLMSTVHEGGHGLYEQGFEPRFSRTFLGQAPSLGLHESQSRFWENLVGRSLPFWRYCTPLFQQAFEPLRACSAESLHAWANRVEPSLVRIEADEVTYNLHVLLRFELELELLRDNLQPAELPAAWNERMAKNLGLTPPDDVLGVMQDIHWAWGEFGYFPTYTLGNLYSALLLEKMESDVPGLWLAVERGELKAVLDWLRAKVHRQGYRFGAEELITRVTGRALSEAPFLAYLWRKYRPLYGL